MKLGQNGPQLLLSKVSALLGDDGRGDEVINVGLDVLKIAAEVVEVGIDLGTVIATAHPIESRRTGRRAQHAPMTRIGDRSRRTPALGRFTGCIAHRPSSSAA